MKALITRYYMEVALTVSGIVALEVIAAVLIRLGTMVS
jgi:hypothetical protein